MKIICSNCKKIMGEKEPFNDSAEIKAKCTACISKEKEEASGFIHSPKLGQNQEIVFKNGLKGVLWVAKDKKDKLFLGELVVSGKKFFPTKSKRMEFQNFLGGLKGEEADVIFLHTISCKIDTLARGRRKKQNSPKAEERKKEDSIQYNCTMRVPKYYAQLMFDDMAERMDKAAGILAEVALKSYNDEQKVTQNEG